MFFRGLIGYLPANILQGIIGFATLMIFTRILSPDDYGRYALAFGVASLAQTVFFTWIEAAMARFYPAEAKTDDTAPQLYGTLYRLFGCAFAAFAVAVALGLMLWPAHDTSAQALKTAIGLSLGCVVFRSLAKLVQEQRKSEGRVATASMIDMIQTAGGFGLGVLCATSGLGGASPVLGAGLIAALCLPFFAREDWSRAAKGRFDPVRAKAYAHYGFPVSASLILTLALYTVDRFMIAHYLDTASAGAYQAGFSIASRILDVLFIWFGAAGCPAMVNALEHGGEDGLKTAARQQLTTMAFVLFPAVGGLIMVAPALGSILIGEGLRAQALSVTPLIAAGALFSGFNSYYFLQAFTLAKRTRLLMLAMTIPAISNIALNLWLIPAMGLMGAAVASCVSFALGLIGSWLLGLRTLALPVPAAALLKTLACVAVMMAALAVLPAWGGFAELILKGTAGLVLYATLAYVLNINDMRTLTASIYQRLRARVAA